MKKGGWLNDIGLADDDYDGEAVVKKPAGGSRSVKIVGRLF